MCSDELKGAEVVHTGFFACELDRFLFGNKIVKRGACYHQYPVAKVVHSIPVADLYVCGFHTDGCPGSPIVLGDMKLENLEMARKETAASCVKAMEVYAGDKTTTVNLGLAMTKDRATLFVNLGGDSIMYQIEVCHISHSNHQQHIQAFFTVLYGAVHYLIEHPIALEEPCVLPFRELYTEQLGHRVFLDNDTVYYDTEFCEDPSPSLEALKHLRSDYLQHVKLEKLNERVSCLQYTYICGQMQPSDLRQFAYIMCDLNMLHVVNIVHGDIRNENLLFSCESEQAWLLDFDLCGLEDTPYPPNYNAYRIRERRPGARAAQPRKKIHDIYALSIIIQDWFGQTSHTYTLLQEPNPDLCTIAQNLLDSHS